jgi:hypothetical protein
MNSIKNLTIRIGYISLVLILLNIPVTANQSGSIPTGEFWVNDSSIIQSEGEYSFYYQLNEHTIGDDNSRYKNNFIVMLDINVSDFNRFFMVFEFSTPFETLIGGSPALAILGDQHMQLNWTNPLLEDNSIFEYSFTPIDIERWVGRIRLELTLTTETEMSEVHGIEKFGIELSNGTVYSETCVDFHIATISYSTTEGPDNRFIAFNFISSLVIFPILVSLRRFNKNKIY